jgi:hypothetical protein
VPCKKFVECSILSPLQNYLHDSTLKGESEKMKRFALAIALACVLSGSALAGDAHTVGAPAPGETSGPPAPGDMGNGGRTDGEMGNGAPTALLMILDLLF